MTIIQEEFRLDIKLVMITQNKQSRRVKRLGTPSFLQYFFIWESMLSLEEFPYQGEHLDHVLEHNVISDQQFGFRPGSSTQEAILSAAHSWHITMEEGGSNVVVFLDLAKAFDTIQHDRVLSTLTSAGVSGPLPTWFTSYLSRRQQFVVVQGSSSTPTAVTSGVPQGSILGPLLFLLAFDGIFPSLPFRQVFACWVCRRLHLHQGFPL